MIENVRVMPLPEHIAEEKVVIQNYDLICRLRALWAVIKKELTIVFRYPSWMVGMIIWPLILPLQYILGGKALAGPDQSGLATFSQLAGTNDYIGYMAIGSLLWMWMNMVLWGFGNHLRHEQVRGTLESNWQSPMPRIFMLVGAGLSNCLQQILVILISLVQFYLFLGVRMQGSPWAALLVILLVTPTVYGIGLLFASLVIWAKEVHTMVFLVRGIMMVFCGITYPLAVMPNWMQSVANWIPMTYGIRAFRMIYLTDSGLEAIKGDLYMLGLFSLIFVVLGVFTFKMTETLVRKKGTLGVY